MTKSVGMLLKVEIGGFNKKNIAGTEQIFIDDISSLAKKGYTVLAFARFSDQKLGISQIKIPNLLYSIIRWLRGIRNRRYNSLYYGVKKIVLAGIELWYTWQFKKQTKKCPVVIGYSTPTLALFRERSIIMMHNAHHTFHFSSLFSSRYINSTYLFCSDWLRQYYLRKYSFINKNNSFVLYNAIDTKLFKAKSLTSHTAHKKLRLLYTGAWHQKKGLHILLDALKKLPSNQKNSVELVITSNKDLWYTDFPEDGEDYIQGTFSKIKTLGKSVRLIGGVSRKQMPHYYQYADFLVMPSLWKEPFGLSALESIACGTPVISFGTGGQREILSSTNSIIIPPNQKSLTTLVSELIDKPLKKNGKQLLTEKNANMIQDKRLNNLINHFSKEIPQ